MLLALVADHNTETDGTRRQELIWTPMLVVKPKCPYQVECLQRTLETWTEKKFATDCLCNSLEITLFANNELKHDLAVLQEFIKKSAAGLWNFGWGLYDVKTKGEVHTTGTICYNQKSRIWLERTNP